MEIGDGDGDWDWRLVWGWDWDCESGIGIRAGDLDSGLVVTFGSDFGL